MGSSARRRFGHYEALEVLGQGGAGTVYKGLDPAGREVALKVLAPEHAVARERMLRELRGLARLDHPHLVPLRDAGEQDGAVFLVMDYVPGGTLEDQLRHGPLPPPRALEISRQLAEGVAHAHARGVLHRDIKPANVLLDPAGPARLTDFGLALLAESAGRERLTVSGAYLGTPGFLAPEQALGKREQFGPETDVYGLGATLYAMLTGSAPIAGQDLQEVLVRTVELPPTPPERLAPAVPRWLSEVCLRCLEKKPERRYRSAAGFAAALSPPAGRSRSRGVAAAILALACAGSGALVLRPRPVPTGETTRPAPAPADLAEWVRRGDRLREEGHPDEALAEYARVLHQDPQHLEALWGQARIQCQRPDGAPLQETLEALLALSPAHVGALALRAELAAERGRYQDALHDAEAALRLDPNQLLALEVRAFAQHRLGRLDAAAADWRRLVLLAPTGSALGRNALFNLASTLAQLGLAEEAILAYDAVIEHDPDRRLRARRERGLAHLALGHHREAAEDLTRYLQLAEGPPDPDLIHNRGCAYVELGRLEEALADFQAAWEQAPSAISGAAIAETLGRLGRDAEAEATFARVLQRWPDPFFAWQTRGDYWLQRARADLAASDLSCALERGAGPDCQLLLFRARLLRGEDAGRLTGEVEAFVAGLARPRPGRSSAEARADQRLAEDARRLLEELTRGRELDSR